ncbi:MAG: purine-binding chemotaxis protein CheW [Candidatus Latescibacterota bacterium]|jgi:purine-binding chemotaxis protein CheW
MAEPYQICTFYIGNYYFGIDVQVVQEVIVRRKLTPVPLAPSVVCGILNLRGQIVTSIDLRHRLELSTEEKGVDPIHVVIHAGEDLVNVLVDSIGEVLEVDENDFERTPDTLRGTARELIMGAYKLPDRLLLILDPDKIVELEEIEPELMG